MTTQAPQRVAGQAAKPSRIAVWVLAARTRTLPLSLSPVLVGAAIAATGPNPVHWVPVLVAALASALIQIGANLYNDAADSRRGADGAARVGPPRVTALGLIDGERVAAAAFACFGAAALAGLYLVLVGGWPILALGLASLVCGWGYSGGPAPIAYTPYGEVFVLLFFGIFAVTGTSWLAAQTVGAASLLAGAALGLFAAAVLLVNNHRDRVEDTRAGRRTLAILIGAERARWLYAALILTPFLLLWPIALALPGQRVWPALTALPFALIVIARLWREPPGRGLNAVLALTAQVQSVYALLLAVGLFA
ncbi:1,4-dihydroxy-2-naphthoate prenyltransferase [Roseiarcus fermentans]|uniref:1,4-dihydroxy-2-naphthoate octaprenyltransferase n=1 Tax=Roseiarcus fermentans TaxID=1473586 RepID=A0A366FL28_9HYPH|nr:1,4-dihydroxy-2-naphthoate polyprenyltransferase [Roseiarcus fermentans]RBP14435.1 1,4-dihydroxy-2-naphthoate prenyltransferase [Roseiarcus fermentans]